MAELEAGHLAAGRATLERYLDVAPAGYFREGLGGYVAGEMGLCAGDAIEAERGFGRALDWALQPFGLHRSGTVLGEGAAVFVAEELGAAQRRGARIDAEVVGFASGFDRGLTGTVLANVVRTALKEAGISPAEVDHVNANAGGFGRLDAWEAAAIREVFGDAVEVFAPKAHLGATGAASGLLELAASVLAFKHGTLPGTRNAGEIDPAFGLRVVTEPRPVVKPYAVKINATMMGQCAAVVVRRWDR